MAEPRVAEKFQAAMLSNDWLCDSTVGHEVGTCLGCITVALSRSGVDALAQRVAELEAALRAIRDLHHTEWPFRVHPIIDTALAMPDMRAALAEPEHG